MKSSCTQGKCFQTMKIKFRENFLRSANDCVSANCIKRDFLVFEALLEHHTWSQNAHSSSEARGHTRYTYG